MKKELKQILFICVFLIVGCIIGYFFAIYQINQYKDPTFMALLASHNMSSSEPIGLTKSIINFGCLLAGIAIGGIFYNSIAKKWLTPIAPKIFIGFITFPFYTLAGIIGFIPFIIYKKNYEKKFIFSNIKIFKFCKSHCSNYSNFIKI